MNDQKYKKNNTIETIYLATTNTNICYFNLNVPFEVKEIKILQFITSNSNSSLNLILKSDLVNNKIIGTEQFLITYDATDAELSYYRKNSDIIYHYILDTPKYIKGTYSVSLFDNLLSSANVTGNWIVVAEFIG